MRLLDLFCGAGGAAMGYSRAGFDEIVGVDNRPQPRYPFEFVHTPLHGPVRVDNVLGHCAGAFVWESERA